jgi:PleD family two-component response regulator
MSKPLALLYYSNLMPGTQLSNRLLDLGYRVHILADMAHLAESCQREKPLVVVAEILPDSPAFASITQLKKDPATQHIPVLGYSAGQDAALQQQATDAGVALLAGNAAIAEHLPRLLDQVLQVD